MVLSFLASAAVLSLTVLSSLSDDQLTRRDDACFQPAELHFIFVDVPCEVKFRSMVCAPDILEHNFSRESDTLRKCQDTLRLVSREPALHGGFERSSLIPGSQNSICDYNSRLRRAESNASVNSFQYSWRFAVVFNPERDTRRTVARVIDSLWITEIESGRVDYTLLERPRTIDNRINIGALNDWKSVSGGFSRISRSTRGLRRDVGYFPHSLAGPIECPGETRNGNSRDSGYNSVVRVKECADLDDYVRRNMIGGALFLAGVFVFVAYVIGERGEH